MHGGMRPAGAALVIGLGLAGVAGAAPPPARAAAAETARPDFALLDAMDEQIYACDQASEREYWSGVPKRMTTALEIQAHCLEEVAATLAEEFYPPDAFGPDGIRGRIAELRTTMSGLYGAVHTAPVMCTEAPESCGDIYRVWALESTVTAVRALVDAMIDRLKDQSPLHMP